LERRPLQLGNRTKCRLWIARPTSNLQQRLERQLQERPRWPQAPMTGWPRWSWRRLSRDGADAQNPEATRGPGIRPCARPSSAWLSQGVVGSAGETRQLEQAARPAAAPMPERPKPWAAGLLRSICRDANQPAQRCRLSQRLIERSCFNQEGDSRIRLKQGDLITQQGKPISPQALRRARITSVGWIAGPC